MISYRSPKASALCYFINSSAGVLGPFNAGPEHDFDSIEVRDPGDFIKTTPGVYGENNVSHRQFHAVLSWSPLPGLKTVANGKPVSLYQRTASGNFRSTNYPLQVNLDALLKVSEQDSSTDQNMSRLVGPMHVRYGTIYRTFGNVSSITTVTRMTITEVKYQYVDYTTCSYVQTATTYTWKDLRFRNPAAYGTHPYNINGENMYTRIWRGDYPPDAESKTVTQGTANIWWHKTPINPGTSLASVIRDVRILPDLDLPLIPKIDEGDLATKAVEQLDANNVNMIAFLKDIRKPWELIPKLKELSKLKTHASNYLGYEYGIMPTISDLKEIHEAVTKRSDPYRDPNRFRVLSSGASTGTTTTFGTYTLTKRVKVAIDDSDPQFQSLSNRMHNVGIFPSLSNLYDLVPYSFVVDWFVSVGDMLEEVDKRGRVASLDVKYSTSSSKLVIDFVVPKHLQELGVTGKIQLVHYSRTTGNGAPSTPLNFEGRNELPSHWLEAGALIVTRTK